MQINTSEADLLTAILLVLLHSLWQAAAVILPTWVALRMIPARKCDLRYLVSLCGLIIVILATFATWSVVQHGNEQVVVAINDNAVEQPSGVAATVRQWLPIIAPWLIFVWSCGVVIMLGRTIRGLLEVRLLLNTPLADSESMPQLAILKKEVAGLRQKLSLRTHVTLQVCEKLASPAIAGTLWPVLLLPVNMLTTSSLSVDDWRIILAHELAHVRRFDVLVNFAQRLIECGLFFNPAVWWLNRQIRIEREACCDAIAAKITGQPLSVAHTLLTVAAAAQHSTRTDSVSNVPATAVAFAAETNGAELADRVGRLADPAKAPGLQSRWMGLTWLSMVLSLLLLAGVAVALQKGTDVAVRTAMAYLSPQEQVDELARAQAMSIGVVAPMSDGNAATDIAVVENNAEVEIEIVVRTADGSPIPRELSVRAIHQDSNGGKWIGLGHERGGENEYRYEPSFQGGALTVIASAEGFAPAISPTMLLRPGMDKPTIELNLIRGFEKQIVVQDENGVSVSGMTVNVRALAVTDTSTTNFSFHRYESEVTDGSFVIPNVAEADGLKYQMKIFHRGWEFQEDSHVLKQNDPFVLRLRKAVPTTLTLIDRRTGKPAEGAKVQMCGWTRLDDPNGAGPYLGDPRDTVKLGRIAGHSNHDGIAVLNTLRGDQKHLLCIHCEGYQPTLVYDVLAGQTQTVKLEKAIVFEGKVVGDLALLKQIPHLQYQNDLRYRSGGYSGWLQAPVNKDGTFRIDNLVGPTVQFSLPNGVVRMSAEESRNDVILDLNKSAEELNPMPMRDVQVRLTGLPEGSLVRGDVRFWWTMPDNPRGNGHEVVAVKNATASLKLPVGARFTVRREGLVGCTFEQQKRFVSVGDGPQVENIPVVPSGGVFGTVVDANGGPPGRIGVYLMAVEDLGDRSRNSNIEAKINEGLGTFFSSVPFDGEYVALVRHFEKSEAHWVVSKPFRINRENPIQELSLQLHHGKPFPVTVVDDAGNPVADAKVELYVEHSLAGGINSQGVAAITGDDGVALFSSVVRDAPSGPATVRLNLDVKPVPGKTGWRGRIDTTAARFTARVDDAVGASGIVIDEATGRPIPNAEVRVYPLRSEESRYASHMTVLTDVAGRFEHRSLEAIEYRVFVGGTYRRGVSVTRNPNGGYSSTYPNGPQAVEELTLRGGVDRDKEFRVFIHPGGHLTPATE